MKQYGLIGYPLDHSFSQRYFSEKFLREGISGVSYQNFPIPQIEDLKELLTDQTNLRGFNVTIPYKTQIIPLLDEIDTHASSIGAVNTVKIENGKLSGFNTDWIGFMESIKPMLTSNDRRALVLGTGGSSKAIFYALNQLGIGSTLVSRNPDKEHIGYDDIDVQIMSSHQIIVQCTPLGTYPRIDECPPMPYSLLNESHMLFDLVYNPEMSRFLQHGKNAGTRIQNGFAMLVGQAEAAWKIWKS